MNGFKKALPLFIIYFLGSVVVVVIGMGSSWWPSGLAPAVVKVTAGHPGFVSAALYGLTSEESAAVTASLASGGLYGENTAVQNLQPPSISGFSSDLFTGNSTVNYSLDIPPGRGGLTPSVSLTYSSSGVYDPLLGADFVGPDSDFPDGTHD